MIPAHLIDGLVDLEWWQQAARCRDLDSSLFFPARGESSNRARAVCAECPVSSNCLEMAITERLEVGIFGGKTPRERKVLRRQRRHDARQVKTA